MLVKLDVLFKSVKKEHMRVLTNSNAMTSALVEHAMDTMHKIDGKTQWS